ncbi:hypothetical protein J5N97_006242 [Dioscorea zingiberensis]|uniref:Uncharacterized protein n=1 Tax=Dioscorea zingiberensis TaxID=325984 RepID=A0A9D5HTG9_9LILI|nr:hypothetical protein J5N97_006242 [Dioscorea zingiberensis]
MAELRDTYNLAYGIHFLLGIAILLPWNTFITAVDYISFLYPKEHVDKAFAVAYMGSSLVVLLVLTGTSNWSRRPSVRSRITAGLFLFICSLMVAPLLDLTDRYLRRSHARYYVMVSALVLCGFADGLVAGSLVGTTGELPKRYMQAVFVGTACSGPKG